MDRHDQRFLRDGGDGYRKSSPDEVPAGCYKFANASTIVIVGRDGGSGTGDSKREELYQAVVRDYGRVLDRLAAGYESDPEKRLDLRQEIHFQLWKSFEVFDQRCSLKTWTFRVAHNTAVTYVNRERRIYASLVSLEEIEQTASSSEAEPDVDRSRALAQLSLLILKLKPLDRQIMISYLEGMDMASIADITGLSGANVAMKIHRIKNILARRFFEEQQHA
jgi:RNA polymerase sigma-70 factor (ECF subfamily)